MKYSSGAVICAAVMAIAGCSGASGGRPSQNSNGPVDGSGQTAEERGRVLFQGQRCINCHGPDGRGSPLFPGAPVVVGRRVEDLRRQLIEPCDPEADITGCHPLKLPDLSEAQLADLEAYLASLANSAGQPDSGPPCDDTPGSICTIAGNGVSGNRAGQGVMAREQYLFWPQNVSLDPQGRVIITDWNNYMIRRIEPDGCRAVTDADGNPAGSDCPIVNIIGSSLLGDSCSNDAPLMASEARLNHPVGVLYDELGNIILWAWHNWKVKYVAVDASGNTGQIYCLFGNCRGFSGDGQAAGFNVDGREGPTRFNLPSSCVYDNGGNFYISDQANLRIRRVRADPDDDNSSAESFVQSHQNNIIETFAGGLLNEVGQTRHTLPDYSDSGDGGPAAQCTFNVQFGFDAVPQMRLALDRARNLLYVADSENHRVRVIDLNQEPPVIATFAGGGSDVVADGVPATDAKLFKPADVDIKPDGSGDVLITDTFNHCVRLVDFQTRTIRTVAGTCGAESRGYAGDGGPATQALLDEPGGSCIAADGTVYVADTLNHRVRRVNPTSAGL
jgi:mono/diheme cytochrome c family protein